jgi:ATP-binding cassette subfamily C protein LapB
MTTNYFAIKNKTSGLISLVINTKDWIRLIRHIPKSKSDATLLVIASVTINILALALPIVLMQIYDRIIPNSSYSTLSWLVMGVVIAIILETALKIARSYISNWLSARIDYILNNEALKCYLFSRLDRYEKDKAGVHFERFNAINTVKSYISGQILLILLDIPFAFLFLGLLYYIGGFLVLYTIGILVVFIIIIMLSKKKFERFNEKLVENNKENLDFILETLGGIHTVKSLSMEERMFRKFENIQARSSDTGYRLNRWKALPTNSTQFFTQANMLGIVFLGADFVIKGFLTIGAMTACTMLATRGLQPIIKFAGFWLRFSEVTTAQNQIQEILDLFPEEDIQQNASLIRDIEGSVSFENFSLKHEQFNIEINNFNALINGGDVVGVTGDNNELTSVLMLSLCGMYKPTGGEIFIDEYRISALEHSTFGGRVGYIPRKGRLFNGSILDNISMFDSNMGQIALDTASLLELDKFVSDLPNGYETMVDQRANESLPLGILQRTCFARALINLPRILIIDRTLNSMDAETHDLVCEILNSLKGKTTFFIVSDHGVFPVNNYQHSW